MEDYFKSIVIKITKANLTGGKKRIETHHKKDKSKTQVHLEIWKGMTKLNPEYWITR